MKSFPQFLRQYSSYSISSCDSAWNVRNKNKIKDPISLVVLYFLLLCYLCYFYIEKRILILFMIATISIQKSLGKTRINNWSN